MYIMSFIGSSMVIGILLSYIITRTDITTRGISKSIEGCLKERIHSMSQLLILCRTNVETGYSKTSISS